MKLCLSSLMLYQLFSFLKGFFNRKFLELPFMDSIVFLL